MLDILGIKARNGCPIVSEKTWVTVQAASCLCHLLLAIYFLLTQIILYDYWEFRWKVINCSHQLVKWHLNILSIFKHLREKKHCVTSLQECSLIHVAETLVSADPAYAHTGSTHSTLWNFKTAHEVEREPWEEPGKDWVKGWGEYYKKT